MDDWEYSDSDCPKCQSQLATRTCYACAGYGRIEDDDWDECNDTCCDNCNGEGDETWCRECGWDVNFNCFLQPAYEEAWLAKQAEAQKPDPP